MFNVQVYKLLTSNRQISQLMKGFEKSENTRRLKLQTFTPKHVEIINSSGKKP